MNSSLRFFDAKLPEIRGFLFYLRVSLFFNNLLLSFCFFFLNTLLVLTSCFLPLLDTEDASETDLAKHEEEDFVEMKEQ